MLGILFVLLSQTPQKVEVGLNEYSCHHVFNGSFEFTYPDSESQKPVTSIYKLEGSTPKLLKKINFFVLAMNHNELGWIFGTYNGALLFYSENFDLLKVDYLPKKSAINGIFGHGPDSLLLSSEDGSLYEYNTKTSYFKHILNYLKKSKPVFSKKFNRIFLYNKYQAICYDIKMGKISFATPAKRPIKTIELLSEETKLAIIFNYNDFENDDPVFDKQNIESYDIVDAKTGILSETRKFSPEGDIHSFATGNENVWFTCKKTDNKFLFNKIDPTKAPEFIKQIDFETTSDFAKKTNIKNYIPFIYYLNKNSIIVQTDTLYILNF